MLEKIITILYLSGESIKVDSLAKIIGESREELEKAIPQVRSALESIGLSLLAGEEGLSIVTKPEQAELVGAFWKEELQGELTPAALQVLTLVAYLGTPTREEISYIRGVQSSQSIRALAVRGLIVRQGEQCRLTSEALKQFGVTSQEDLPEYASIHASLTEKLASRNV